MMRAVTLTQPWATLAIIGAKKIETRSWPHSYRGLLAIHAAKGWTQDDRDTCSMRFFREALAAAGIEAAEQLPRGAILGLVTLAKIVTTEEIRDELTAQERAFGNYGNKRFAWLLDKPMPFNHPIPIKGALGLWSFDSSLLELPEMPEQPLTLKQGRLF